MKKKLIFALAMLILFLTSTSISYALFHFSTDQTVFKNICVDPIKENYDFSGSRYVSKDIFDVYFFPQPRYATGGKKVSTRAEVDAVTKEQIIGYVPTNNKKVDFSDPNVNESSTVEGITNTRSNKGGYYQEFDGYFTDIKDTIVRQKPKVEKADVAIEDSTFYSVGKPICDMKDSKGYDFYFSGWSVSQSVAADLGYGGTGNFSLIQSSSPLSVIDYLGADGKTYKPSELVDSQGNPINVKSIDGSYCGDGDIFLYPIFTSGKDYDKAAAKNLDCIYIESYTNSKDRQYMSTYDLSGDTNFQKGRAYMSSSIHITSRDVESKVYNLNSMFYYIYKGIFSTYDGWAASPYNGTFDALRVNNKNIPSTDSTMKGLNINKLNLIPDDSSVKDTTNNTITVPNPNGSQDVKQIPFYNKAREGNYNIYFFVLNAGVQPNNTMPSGFAKSYIPESLKSKKISDIFYINSEWNPGSIVVNRNFKVQAWIYVEEKFDYKIVGGNSMSFDPYDNATLVNPINRIGTEFVAPNVTASHLDMLFTYYTNRDGQGVVTYERYKHIFKKSVFTIIPTPSNPKQELDKNYTIKIKDYNPSMAGIQNDYLEFATSYVDDPNNWDYKTDPNSYFDTMFKGKMLKIKQNGNFDIRCSVTYGANNHKTIEVDAIDKEQILFVSIYAKKSDIVFDAEGFIDFDRSAKPLYVSDERLIHKIPNFQYLMLGDYFDANTQFSKLTLDPNTNTYKHTLTNISKIYSDMIKQNPNAKLHEITTGAPVLIENGAREVMLRNRVFYIE